MSPGVWREDLRKVPLEEGGDESVLGAGVLLRARASCRGPTPPPCSHPVTRPHNCCVSLEKPGPSLGFPFLICKVGLTVQYMLCRIREEMMLSKTGYERLR